MPLILIPISFEK